MICGDLLQCRLVGACLLRFLKVLSVYIGSVVERRRFGQAHQVSRWPGAFSGRML